MYYRTHLIELRTTALLSVLTGLIPCILLIEGSIGYAQTEGEARKLFRQAVEQSAKAQSVAQWQEIVGKMEKVVDHFRNQRDKTKLSRALANLGAAYTRVGKYEKAKTVLEEALSMQDASTGAPTAHLILFNLAGITAQLRQFRESEQFYIRALAAADRIPDNRAKTETLRFFGLMYVEWRKPGKAIQRFQEALATHASVRDPIAQAHLLADICRAHRLRGSLGAAEDSCRKALAVFEEYEQHGDFITVLSNLAQIYAASGKFDEARDQIYSAIRLDFEKFHGKREQGLLMILAGIHWQEGGKAALRKMIEELPERAGWQDANGQTKAVELAALFLWDRSHFKDAADYFKEAYKLRQQNPKSTPDDLRAPLFNLGNLYMKWGRFEKALDSFQSALAVPGDFKSLHQRYFVYQALGSTLSSLGRYSKARQYLQRAVEGFRTSRGLGLGFSLDGLGNIYLQEGNYLEAEKSFKEALSIFRAENLVGDEFICLSYLGRLYGEWGLWDLALKHFHDYLNAARRSKRQDHEAGAFELIASLYHSRAHLENDKGYYEKALKNYHNCLQLMLDSKSLTSPTHERLVHVYLDLKNLAKAEEHASASGLTRPWARLHLERGAFDSAAEIYQRRAESARRESIVDDLFIALTGLGMCSENSGNITQAAEHYRQAVSLVEDLRERVSVGRRQGYFSLQKEGMSRLHPYEGLARSLVAAHDELGSFLASELGKARFFADTVGGKSNSLARLLPEGSREKVRDVNSRLSGLEARLRKAQANKDADLIHFLSKRVNETRGERLDLAQQIRKECPEVASTLWPKIGRLSDSEVRDNEWVLAFEVTDRSLIKYLLKGKRILECQSVDISRENLLEEVNAFLQFTRPSEPDNPPEHLNKFDLEVARGLSHILLGGVCKRVPAGEPIIVVPDEFLARIPFEALVLSATGRLDPEHVVIDGRRVPGVVEAKFMGDRHPLSYYHSVHALTLVRRLHSDTDGATRPTRVLVMADPVFSDEAMVTTPERSESGPREASGLAAHLRRWLQMGLTSTNSTGCPVPFRLEATADIAKVLKSIHGESCDLLLRHDASKERFLAMDADKLLKYKHIVFATHGYLGSNFPKIGEPFLVLSRHHGGNAGCLRMSEIMGLKTRADLIALVACHTGGGSPLAGEGIMSLGRAFQYAGAKTVLMSLWEISVTATKKLVVEFFSALHRGKSKIAALHEARTKLRQEGYNHPYYWAGFVLVGEAR